MDGGGAPAGPPGEPDAVGGRSRLLVRLDRGLWRAGVRGVVARDLLLGVVCAGLAVTVLVPLLGPFSTRFGLELSAAEIGCLVAVVVVQSLLLGLRRSRPVTCLLLVVLCQLVLTAVLPEETNLRFVATVVAAYTGGTLLAPARLFRWVGVAVLLEVVGGSLITVWVTGPVRSALFGTPDPGRPGLGLLLLGGVLVVLLYLAAAFGGVVVAGRRAYVALLRDRAADAERSLEARSRAAVNAERSRMARELHDVAAHHLSGLVVQAGAAERLIDRDPAAAKTAVRSVRLLGKEALGTLRQVVGVLREREGPLDVVRPDADADAPVPGLDVLDRLIDRARELGGDLEISTRGGPHPLSPVADVTAYRVLQEALANARRHAPGAPVRVLLDRTGPELGLTVENGRPHRREPAEVRPGYGLLGMRERAQLAGGTLTAGPTDTGGGGSSCEFPGRGRLRRPTTGPGREDRRVIRVLLVDDQAVVRAGFRVILESAGEIEVVGEASTGPAAVQQSRRLRPDVVCIDIRMPGGDGITATREITAAGTAADAPAVLVVTTFDLDEYVFGALEAGARGFVLKDTEPDELVQVVRRLAAGSGLLDHAVTRRVIAEFARRTRPPGPEVKVSDLLTAREADIVRVLARGRSNAEIAAELNIETSTVKSHLTNAMIKLGTRDRLQTVVWAYQHGLVRAAADCRRRPTLTGSTRAG